MLFTNVDPHKLPVKPEQELTPIDLPRMIIGGSNIQTNAVFLADVIATDKNTFVKKNIPNFVALNSAAVSFANVISSSTTVKRIPAHNIIGRSQTDHDKLLLILGGSYEKEKQTQKASQ